MDTHYELSNSIGYNINFAIMHNDGGVIYIYIYPMTESIVVLLCNVKISSNML